MQDSADTERRRQRAEELRAEIDKLRRGGGEAAPGSPRELTDRAAREASERD
jgi:hypothetical protein